MKYILNLIICAVLLTLLVFPVYARSLRENTVQTNLAGLTGSLIPDTDDAYDIGLAGGTPKRWKDAFFSGKFYGVDFEATGSFVTSRIIANNSGSTQITLDGTTNSGYVFWDSGADMWYLREYQFTPPNYKASDLTVEDLVCATVDTGQGAYELYAMNQDVESSDDVTFVGLAVTSAMDVEANSATFQPNADSTTFIQILDADGGTPILNIDSTNERVGIGTATPNNLLQVAGLVNFDDTNFNILLGTDAGIGDSDAGTYNSFIGYHAGYYNDTSASKGNYNVYIGWKAGRGLGSGANVNKGQSNMGIGTGAFQNNTTGDAGIGVGTWANRFNTTGDFNIGIGDSAGYYNVTGNNSIRIGSQAGYGATGQSYSDAVYIGHQAGFATTTGNKNIGIGYRALFTMATVTDNTAIGYLAGNLLTLNGNTLIGAYTGRVLSSAYDNTLIGARSGYSATSANSNSFIGYNSGYLSTTGDANVYIGYKSGYRQTTNSNLLIIDNQDRGTAAAEVAECLVYGTFNNATASQSVTFNADVNIRHHLSGVPDEITATSEGVAASIDTINTEVTTNNDGDLDNVTLANGVSGQIKSIYCVVEPGAGDTWKITPATMCGGTQITFAGVGEGCTLSYADSEGWVVTGNNGGVIS